MKKETGDIKVLIIEDDREKREELTEILRDIGIRLSNIYKTGFSEKGIELLEDELPDVVLLDLNIPHNEESLGLRKENSNMIIKTVERLNAIRNQEDDSTGIIIISASVNDEGLQKSYKHFQEVVEFYDKKDVFNKQEFKNDLLKKILKTVEHDFKHDCQIELTEIRKLKLSKLKEINQELHNRIVYDLLAEFEKLNNRNVNTNRIAENIIGLCGMIVEDITNLLENEEAVLTEVDDSDNFNSVKKRLTKLTGRKYVDYVNYQPVFEIISKPVISRKAADYATYAYKLRSEAIHSKEGDFNNNKVFKDSRYTIEDAAVSINLIMPLIIDLINYKKKQ